MVLYYVMISKFLGGKQYSSQSEDRKKNDEVIMESAKKLIGGVLLTEDKNLLVRYFQ